jgi:type VI secretion system secreted protein Hcp
MAGMRVFMKIEGMPGSSLEENRKDWCDVRAFSQELKYPYDMGSARSAGHPQHGPCTVIKDIDKSSPKLYEALAKNLKVSKVEIEFERDKPGDGSTEVYFKIVLTDCRVVLAHPHIPMPGAHNPDIPPHLDEIGFGYRKIDWEWLSGGKLPTTFDFNNPSA